MSDLISRRSVLEEMEKINIELLTVLRHARAIQDISMEAAIKIQISAMYTAIGCVKAAPAAYDVDNAIEQLGELTGEECTLHECGVRSEHCKSCIAQKAIEIVKAGGVNE